MYDTSSLCIPEIWIALKFLSMFCAAANPIESTSLNLCLHAESFLVHPSLCQKLGLPSGDCPILLSCAETYAVFNGPPCIFGSELGKKIVGLSSITRSPLIYFSEFFHIASGLSKNETGESGPLISTFFVGR